MPRSSRHWLPVLCLLALAGGATALWLRSELSRAGDNDAEVSLQVPAGASLRGVLGELQARGAVHHSRLLEWYARWKFPGQPMLKTGRYLIPPHVAPQDLLAQLREGRVVLEQFTVIEGWTFLQMRRALDADAAVAHDWQKLPDAEVMARLGHAGLHPEGRFFPDTYRFAAGTADSTVYQLAFARMEKELAQAWSQRAPDLSLHSADELLIFASIVEKETGRDDEREKVAAVFLNRLRSSMRLQSDPTIIYGLGAAYDGDLRNRDMTTDTPYNTYTRSGLPPTPISLPGARSLQAATHPHEFDALYFVASSKCDGTHHFSMTYPEHEAEVQKYIHSACGRR
jgi:UPF0755 protein